MPDVEFLFDQVFVFCCYDCKDIRAVPTPIDKEVDDALARAHWGHDNRVVVVDSVVWDKGEEATQRSVERLLARWKEHDLDPADLKTWWVEK